MLKININNGSTGQPVRYIPRLNPDQLTVNEVNFGKDDLPVNIFDKPQSSTSPLVTHYGQATYTYRVVDIGGTPSWVVTKEIKDKAIQPVQVAQEVGTAQPALTWEKPYHVPSAASEPCMWGMVSAVAESFKRATRMLRNAGSRIWAFFRPVGAVGSGMKSQQQLTLQ